MSTHVHRVELLELTDFQGLLHMVSPTRHCTRRTLVYEQHVGKVALQDTLPSVCEIDQRWHADRCLG